MEFPQRISLKRKGVGVSKWQYIDRLRKTMGKVGRGRELAILLRISVAQYRIFLRRCSTPVSRMGLFAVDAHGS